MISPLLDRFLFSALFGALLLFSTSAWAEYELVYESSYAGEMLEHVNQARVEGWQCGEEYMEAVPPLEWSDELAEAAQIHSDDLATPHTYFSHSGSDRSSPRDRVHRVSTDYHWVGENLALGPRSAANAVEGLLDSPGHCRNIMNPNFTHLGASVTQRVDESAQASPFIGRPYWVQVFGRHQGASQGYAELSDYQADSCHLVRARDDGHHPDLDRSQSPPVQEYSSANQSKRSTPGESTDPRDSSTESGLVRFLDASAGRGARFGFHVGGGIFLDDDSMTTVHMENHRLALGLQARLPHSAQKGEHSMVQWAGFVDLGIAHHSGLDAAFGATGSQAGQFGYSPFGQFEGGLILLDRLRLSGGAGLQQTGGDVSQESHKGYFSTTTGFSVPMQRYHIEILGSALFFDSSSPTFQVGGRIGFVFGP